MLTPEDAKIFADKCNTLSGFFTKVFNVYTNTEGTPQRGFILFTPKGGRGRSPELHIDNSVLSLHWSAALSSFRIHDGELPDEVWNDLSMIKRKQLHPEQNKDEIDAIFGRLIELGSTIGMTENSIGDVMITKGQRGKDLDDKEVQQSVCVHVSSPSIIKSGLVAYLMTPQM